MRSRMDQAVWFFVVSLSASAAWGASKVTSIDFKSAPDASVIQIKSDAPLTFEKQENTQDKQLVINLDGVTLTKNASRKLDTSSFNSKVKLVSPYQLADGDRARVVVQLRDNVNSEVSQDGNVLTIRIPQGSQATPEPAATEPAPFVPGESTGGVLDAGPTSSGGAAAPAPTPKMSGNGDAAMEKELDEYLAASKNKTFKGTPVTIQVREANILEVLQMIGEASGFNVVVGDDVNGNITLSLVDVPWDQALDLILTSRQLGAERTFNVLRIARLATLTAEKRAELEAKRAQEANAPRVTRVFPISYARLSDLQNVFTRFASASGTSSPENATVVQPDERTNSMIVRDTAENIERIRKLIEILDTQTPQVLIEARIIEASEGFATGMSGNLGFSRRSSTFLGASANAGGSNGTVANTEGDATGTLVGALIPSAGAAKIGFSPVLGFLPGRLSNTRLNAFFQISESENKSRTIASPRVVVLNKESATIVSGTPVLVSVPGTGSQGVAAVAEVRQANMSLGVRPTVTNDGSVMLELSIQRDVPSGPGIANRNMSTRVIVDNGSTLVIGGIFVNDRNENASGVPFLRKIPVLGAFFGDSGNDENRFELMIFVTPRVLNEKEAGLAG